MNKIVISTILLVAMGLMASPVMNVFAQSNLKMKTPDNDEDEISDFKIQRGTEAVTCTADNGETKTCEHACIAGKDFVQCIKVDEPSGSDTEDDTEDTDEDNE